MAITSTSNLTGLVATAYDRAVEFAFQPNLQLAQFASEKRWALSSEPVPGDTIRFTIYGALSAAIDALPETTDPGKETMSKTGKNVSLLEQGKLITTTEKLRKLSFADIDLDAGKLVGDNMGKSLDLISRVAYNAQTGSAYIYYASAAVHATGVESTMYLGADEVRYAFNRLQRGDVPKMGAGFYAAVIHADCAIDLKNETGNAAWRIPRNYVDPEEIYQGELGEFEGFRFVVSSHASYLADGGSASVDLYYSYFIGFQALAYAEGIPPGMNISGPFDAFQRLKNVYWYSLCGFDELRSASLFKVYSASSVGA